MKLFLLLTVFLFNAALLADEPKPITVASQPVVILELKPNGDVVLRGKVIAHDDELGKIITDGQKTQPKVPVKK